MPLKPALNQRETTEWELTLLRMTIGWITEHIRGGQVVNGFEP